MFSHDKKDGPPTDLSEAPMHRPKKGFEDIYDYKRTLSKHSKEIIKKGAPYKKLDQHFVGMSQLDLETKTLTHFTVPTIEILDSTDLKINEYSKKKLKESSEETIKIFGEKEVAPVQDIPGSAHHEGKKIAQTEDTYDPTKPGLGWSGFLYEKPTEYTGRSWMNEDIFELHPVARYAFYFDFKKAGYFSFGAYANQERLRRTIPPDFFESMMQDLQEKIQDILLLDDTPPFKIDDKDVKAYEAIWDRIKKDPEKKEIAIFIMQSIYNASGLDFKQEIEFMKGQHTPDQTIIGEALAVAKQYGIPLNLEHIPPFFPTNITLGATALLLAVKKGDLQSVSALIDAKANINAKDNNDDNIIQYALQYNQQDILAYLLSNKGFGISLDEENKRGETAIMNAVKKGNAKAVKLLLDAKANSSRDHQGVVLMHHAAFSGNIDTIKLLLTNKPSSPLLSAGHFKKSVATGSMVDGELNTPLHYFASSGVSRIDSKIIELFAKDINAQNKEGLTPLAMALISRDSKMAKVLINHGADISLLPKEISANKEIQEFLVQFNPKPT